MSSRHTDYLIRKFISGTSDPLNNDFNVFEDVQDPTFLSFKLDFFPDGGLSMPTDTYSSGGLFRKSTINSGSTQNSMMSYEFYDSAAEYLARIGAPGRQAALEEFVFLLKKIQNNAPWYFQSIGGLGDLYKIEKANNYRGKDKVLTIDCLESVDMRMSLLGDLYRVIAFDMDHWREVLPLNLRTFNMYIHVLEMRKFNTTFGNIADYFSGAGIKGESRQKNILNSSKEKYSTGSSSLFKGTFDNLKGIGNRLNGASGGLYSGIGNMSNDDSYDNVKSSFEAISVQTFCLRECEFDFFTESPGYLDSVSVKDSQEATYRFKINVGRIEKVGVYSFYDYILSEWMRNTKMATNVSLTETGGNLSEAYFEEHNIKPIAKNSSESSFDPFSEYKESIYPSAQSQSDSYKEKAKAEDELRKSSLEIALSSVVRNYSSYANEQVNNAIGNKTNGVLGNSPMGNVYEDVTFAEKANEELTKFLGNVFEKNS